MASTAPVSPMRRKSSMDYVDEDNNNDDRLPSSPRARLNSKEIPRTYSGLYGAGAGASFDEDDDINNCNDNHTHAILSPPRVKSEKGGLLPFELSHNRNTDWITSSGPTLLVTYISTIAIFLLTFLAFITEPKMAWTMMNVSHGLVSMVYLHWIKGNPADYMDGTQGEMNAMTTWEQIVSKPANHAQISNAGGHQHHHIESSSPIRGIRDSMTNAIKKLRSRDVLCVVPTLLAHASCHNANYDFNYVLINVGIWSIVMLPKIPFMNGVRILGINRTAGIDDCEYDDEEEDDECLDTEEDTSKEESAVGYNFSDEVEEEDEPKKDR